MLLVRVFDEVVQLGHLAFVAVALDEEVADAAEVRAQGVGEVVLVELELAAVARG